MPIRERVVTTLLASASVLFAVGVATSAGCRRPTRSTPHARDPSLVPRLGAHALVFHDQNKGVTPATTAPIATRARDSVLLAVSMGRTVNFVTPTDSYDNRWSLIGRRNPYANGPFYTAVWSAVDARGGQGHTLSQTKSSDPADEISLAFIAIVNAGAIGDAAYAYAKAGDVHTAGSVRTSGPAMLVAIWGGDGNALAHTAVPSDGFEVIDSYLTLGPTSGVQIAVAAKEVAAAGSYSMRWTATPAQGAACYLIAVE